MIPLFTEKVKRKIRVLTLTGDYCIIKTTNIPAKTGAKISRQSPHANPCGIAFRKKRIGRMSTDREKKAFDPIVESEFRKRIKLGAPSGLPRKYFFYGDEDYLKNVALRLARESVAAEV